MDRREVAIRRFELLRDDGAPAEELLAIRELVAVGLEHGQRVSKALSRRGRPAYFPV